MPNITFEESHGRTTCLGEIEFEFKDANGKTFDWYRERNIVKIFAKEIISHRVPYSKIWDPHANSGVGGWIDNSIDIDEFALKYMVFGASFDAQGNPLDSTDTRFYVNGPVTGTYIPKRLGTGAENDGGLINPIPISEPGRPLKRIERIYFETSYQPAGSPLLSADVRALNNILVLETTLTKEEYNGFGVTSSDYFTITEVALVGAREVDSVGACESDPRDLFLTGNQYNTSFLAIANGSSTISLDHSETLVDAIKEGDQIKIVNSGSTAAADLIDNQLNPYYLVVGKTTGGRDIVLDRIPVDVNGTALTGQIGVLRDGFRIYSARILETPFKKSSVFSVTVRWRLIFN